MSADPYLDTCVVCGYPAVEVCIVDLYGARDDRYGNDTVRDYCAECLAQRLDTTRPFGRCYHCREHDHTLCIGVPCGCSCPAADTGTEGSALARVLQKLTPADRVILRRARWVPALLLAAAIVFSPTPVRAQLPVTDLFALVQHLIKAGIERAINELHHQQAERLYKMSLRLDEWRPLIHYVLDAEFMPEWRIHPWFVEAVLFARPFLWSLTYGDRTGVGYAEVTVPRVPAAEAEAMVGLDPVSARQLRSQLALIDLADSLTIRGTHDEGRDRFNGRSEAQAIIDFQETVTDGSNADSVTAVLDKVAHGTLITAQNRQARIRMQLAILEHQILARLRQREASTAHGNLVTTILSTPAGPDPDPVAGNGDALANWSIR